MATVRIQLRRGEYQDWYNANPQLAAGEVAIETDTNRIKFGDGSTNWRDLDYAIVNNDGTPLTTDDYGQPDGVPQLDGSGYVKPENLPPLAKITVHSVANQAARLALTVEPGDIAIQSDNGTSYVLQSSPASTNANWKELTATQAINDAVNAAVTAMLDGAPGALNTLNELAAAIGNDPAFFTTVATNLSNHEADTTNVHGIANTSLLVTTTGTQTLTNKTITSPSGLVKADVGLGNVDNTSDADKPVSTAQAAADTAVANAAAADATTKANAALASANTYTDGKVADLINSAPGALDTLNELAAAIGDDANYASTVTNALALKAPLANPTFTGTVSGITKAMVGLGNVDNTSDADKPVSTAQAAADTAVANAAAADATTKANAAKSGAEATAATALSNHEADSTNVHGIADTSILVTTTGTQTLTNKTITSPSGLVKADVGLGNVDNTSDANKPVSTATQTALDLKAPIASPTFTGTVSGVTKAMVGLGNVDNTSDADKPVSTAQAAADTAVANAAAADATTKANAAKSGAEATAATALSNHEADSSNVHGIADTSLLVTTTGTQNLTNKTLTSAVVEGGIDINGGVNFEGVTHNDYETTLIAADPTADRTITLPDNSGTVALVSNLNSYAELSGATFTGAVSGTDLTLSGNLTVNGTTTNLNTTNLNVEDKNITLGDTTSPSDATADGGGFSLKGSTDKSFTWLDATDSWTSSENIDLQSGKTYKIDGNIVLSGSQVLGKSVPSGTIVGTSDAQTLTGKTIDLTDNTISGTLAEFNSAVSDADLVSLTGVETLTNKTLQSPAISSPTGILKGDVGLGNVDNTSDLDKPVSTATQSALDLKANLASPTFTGTVVLPSTTSIGNVSSSEIEALDGINSNVQTQIDAKAPSASPTFTGTVVLPSTTSIGNVSSSEIETLDGVTSSIQTQLNARLESATAASTYAPIASPTFTGTVSGVTKAMVGLANVDNTADTAKPVSTATQSALDLKADLAGPTFTGTVTLPGTTAIGNVSSTEIGYLDGVTSGIQSQIDAKLASATAASTYAPIASPTFTGTVSGVTKAMVGLGNVDNTSDANKPVSTATQTALDLKAPIASPTFTGTVSGVTKAMVGLGNVDNTSDANKPVSTATQTALDAKLALAGGTMTGALTLSGAPSSDLHAATKAYVDNVSAGLNFHQPVRVATTANITLSGTQTIDGVAVIAGDRVLVKDQTTQTQNGIYVVAAGSWTRATDADNTPDGELKGGDFTLVLEGTVNSGYGYVCSNTSAITIGTTNVTYSAFNAAKAVTAGSGLTESAPGTIDIATGGVTSAMIADGTIATVDIADGAITSAKIADGTIVNSDINASAAIDWTKLAISSTVSATELGYVDGVTSAIQTQLDSKLASATAASTYAPIASPTFTGTVTVAASGVAFTDGTQTKEGVPSRTTINSATAAYNLSTGGLALRDTLIECNSSSAFTVTIPANSTTAYPIGTSIDLLQVGTGQVTVAGAAGVTLNGTPGLKLRTQWSSATLFKRATDTWVIMGDLTA